MMSIYGLALLSAMVALVSMLNPMPLAALWPTHNLLEQMFLIISHLVAAVDGSLLSRIYCNNVSRLNSHVWPETAPCRDMVLGRESHPSELETLSSGPSSEELFISPTETLSAISDLDEWDIDQLLRHSTGSTYVGDLMRLYREVLSFAGIILLAFIIPLSLYSFGRWFIVRHRQHRFLQIANHEILEFIRDIQAKRTVIMKKMDIAISTIDYQIEEAIEQVTIEKDRIFTGFPFMLEQEVDLLRETLRVQVQSEFEHQATKIKNFIAALEKSRQGLPGPKEIESTCSVFLDEIQRSRELAEQMRSRIHQEMDQFMNFKCNSHQTGPTSYSSNVDRNHIQSENWIRFATRASNPRSMAASSVVDSRISDMKMGVWPEQEQEPRELQRASLAQWRSTVRNSVLTPEEIEQGRKIRRERVNRRLEESTSRDLPPWARVERGGRKQRHPFKSKP